MTEVLKSITKPDYEVNFFKQPSYRDVLCFLMSLPGWVSIVACFHISNGIIALLRILKILGKNLLFNQVALLCINFGYKLELKE